MCRSLARVIGLTAVLCIAFGASQTVAQEIRVPYARGGVGGVPNYYVVQPGDTLFQITEAYFGNPYLWPRVWSYNPQITNPHWIYPGDVVFLRPAADPSDAPPIRPPGPPGSHFLLGGFYTGSELEQVGIIRFSPTPYRSLSLFDLVYIEFDDRDGVEVGDRFSLSRIVDRVEEDGEVVAVKYIVTGILEVIEKPEESPLVIGRILSAWNEILRDDALFVSQRHMRVVEPRPARASVEATIVDFLDPISIAAHTYYIFLDAGYEQGVREGNRFTIWARHDEYVEYRDGEPGFDEDDHAEDIPWRDMGEALVIFTTDDYSTAVLTHSRLELRRGMRATITEGH